MHPCICAQPIQICASALTWDGEGECGNVNVVAEDKLAHQRPQHLQQITKSLRF
jgi:hypothetical protein